MPMFLLFFQAEDGIRDLTVTGVQTCALPIWPDSRANQALVLQVGVGLQHRGMTDAELRTHLAHRRHPLSRLINAAADVFRQLLGDTLIEQQTGHGRLPALLNRYSNPTNRKCTGTVP